MSHSQACLTLLWLSYPSGVVKCEPTIILDIHHTKYSVFPLTVFKFKGSKCLNCLSIMPCQTLWKNTLLRVSVLTELKIGNNLLVPTENPQLKNEVYSVITRRKQQCCIFLGHQKLKMVNIINCHDMKLRTYPHANKFRSSAQFTDVKATQEKKSNGYEIYSKK